jgi:multidrug resistance efflux pump
VVGERDQPIPTPLAQQVADFRRRHLPLAVWVVCAGVCVFMLAGRTQRFDYIALAQSVQYEVSAPVDGRLETVFVDLYDSVGQGEIVAQLADAELTARLEHAQASIRQLRAELLAQRVRLQSDTSQGLSAWTDDLRRFQADEADHRLTALELRAQLRSDEVLAEQTERRLRRADHLLASGVIGELEHDEIRLERDELTQRIEESRWLLAETEREYEAARTRRSAFETSLPEIEGEEPLLEPFREAIAVETQRLREIEAQRDSLVLRSPIDGEVSAILCRSGQAVEPGEPILTITDPQVRDIVAWLDGSDPREVRPNTPVIVTSRERGGRSADSFVVRVGTAIEPLPPRLWPDPTSPAYGRAVIIAALPQMELQPGELLTVRFK